MAHGGIRQVMSTERELYPLTHPQQGIWYTEKMYPGTSIGNVVGTVRIKDAVNIKLLEKAINVVLKKNDSIRLRISVRDDEPKQYVSEYKYIHFDFFDFSKDGIKSMFKWEEKETRKPFQLIDSDLFYFAILKINNSDYRFYIKTHHLISDGWTMNSIANQVMDNYSKLFKGESIDCENKPSYVEYIMKEKNYFNSEKFIKDKIFWNNVFDDVPEISTLKTNNEDMKTTEARRKPFTIPASLASKINKYCIDNKISIFTFFLSILAIYINRITQKEDIVIGTPVLNRSNHREKNMLGMFISTIPIRIKVDDELNLTSFMQKVSKEWLIFLKHHEYPHEFLIKDIRSRHKGTKNLYDIVLSYQNARLIKEGCVHNFEGRWHFNGHQKDPLYIHINDREADGNFIIDYDYITQFFFLKSIEYIHKHLLILLQDAMVNPSKKIYELEILEEEEKERILCKFNNTKIDFPKDKTVHQLFEEQVKRTPDNIAVVFEDKTLTYRELNNKANQLARELRKKGIGPNNIVAIMVHRSLEMIIGIMGILKAGGAYLPLDPEYPEERLSFMLDDSNVRILLTHSDINKNIAFKGEKIFIDQQDIYMISDSDLPYVNSARDLVYVIYTSGSTGSPKGVMLEHRAVSNFIKGVKDKIDFSPGKTILSVTTICFDIFVLETLLPLTSGLKVVIANEDEKKIPRLLSEVILKNNVTMFQTTPSLIQLLLSDADSSSCLKTLSELMIGGEAFPEHLLVKLKGITCARIYNMYGPTETTVWSTIKDLTDASKIDIGMPIANTQVYILDKHLNPVPVGVVGELYIGGDGLARGYMNKPELTRERFVENPFIPGEKMYKTGDIARWFSKGDIEYLGRSDNQVKIRGLRIELGEIENQFMKIDGIINAVVVAHENKKDNKYLCAYFVANKEISVAEIRTQLSKQLPYYMVPSYFIKMNELPFTPNGKIDKKRLPQLDIDSLVEPDYVEPRNEIEEILVKAWKKVLGLQKVGIDNNFFELGGDSLSAIQLQVILLENSWPLNVQDLYTYKTIRELAEIIVTLNEANATKQTENSDMLEICQYDNMDELINIQQKKVNYDNVLLTGTTGFLGIHIVDYLLNNTDTNIYCIVRGKDLNNVKNRLKEVLEFYFFDKYDDIIDKRVFVIKGDITLEKFGIDDKKFSVIGNKIDAIIHSAAIVKYYGAYSEFEKVNVFGTENIVKFAIKFNKPLFYVSTMGVSGQHLVSQTNKGRVFTENDLYIGQNYMENVYVRSKFEAECLIHRNINLGLKAAIFRVGNLTGRYSDGHFQKNIEENYLYNLIKFIVETGALSDSLINGEIEFTPVDLCSKAIVQLIMTEAVTGKTFHLYNNNMMDISDLYNLFLLAGINVKLLDKDSFKTLVLNIASGGLNNKKLIGVVNNFLVQNQMNNESYVRLSSKITIEYLKRIGFEWPQIDVEYFSRLIRYMKKVKFLNVYESKRGRSL